VRAAIDRIDREVSRRVREIEQRDTTLTEMVETYQAQSSLWSDEVRAQQQREIIDGNMELRELERSLREFQEVSEDTVIAPTFERITEAIRQIAEESDLDAVLRSDAAVFAKPELNLTDRVIDRLNAMDPPEFNTPEPVEETP
jgi:outer membrane protein